MNRSRRFLRLLSLLTAVLCCASAAAEGVLLLPEGTEEIAAEAFADNGAIDTLIAPAGLLSVGDRAFRGCFGLNIAELPGTATAIGADAFDDCGAALLIRAPYGSPAHAYALARGLDYQAGTRYRALLIANAYPGSEILKPLNGPPFDAENMAACLAGLAGTPWETQTVTELTAAQIPQAIVARFADAGDADVSLVYYSGHGDFDGTASSLTGTDGAGCYAADLRRVMDAIPGRKVIIIDACYSGGLLIDHDGVETADAAEGTAADFLRGMLAPFARRSRAALTGGSCFVMAACGERERSTELGDPSAGRAYGVFTASILGGIGYRVPGYVWGDPQADANLDGALSFAETFNYAAMEAAILAARFGGSQTAACWPADCGWFAPFRHR